MRLALGLLILLAGCTDKPGDVRPPGGVELLPVTKFVPIDAALLVPCIIAEGSLAAVIDVARDRKASLVQCNAQLDAIRALQPKDAGQ